eukprot:1062786-Amphidinium_carterae.1
MEILTHLGVESADEYSYRLPSATALEDFLATFYEYEVSDRGIVTHNPQPDPAARSRWLQGSVAASLRRLHE